MPSPIYVFQVSALEEDADENGCETITINPNYPLRSVVALFKLSYLTALRNQGF
jgi:hypothetical protein